MNFKTMNKFLSPSSLALCFYILHLLYFNETLFSLHTLIWMVLLYHCP